MSWQTIVITKRAKLDLQLGFMVVRGEDTTKVALNEIAVVFIDRIYSSLAHDQSVGRTDEKKG